jgi:Cytochrome c554 and c-prime
MRRCLKDSPPAANGLRPSFVNSLFARSFAAILAAMFLANFIALPASAQPPHCEPGKILGHETCAKCHAGEVATWQKTPHSLTFETLHRSPRAKEIADLMGQKSIKRGNLCIQCHYTMKEIDGNAEAVSGVSCESCHGAARDWIALHNDYGGLTTTRQEETDSHRKQRFEASIAAGMRNPVNLYLVAQSCLQCHTVPNEKLVNVGTHKAGSEDFELVAWSQGIVRHNFLRTDGKANAASSVERLRVMYIAGQIADLEFSTRATALATEKSTFGITSANRAARVAMRLYEIQQKIRDPVLESVLVEFSNAKLAVNNRTQLESIASRINELGIRFAEVADGTRLVEVDAWLPGPVQYR